MGPFASQQASRNDFSKASLVLGLALSVLSQARKHAAMQNLRDKLLKAGLVSQEDAKKAEVRPPRPKPPLENPQREKPPTTARAAPRRDARPPPRKDFRNTVSKEAFVPKLPPLPGSREFQRLESKKQRQIDIQLREWVLQNQIAPETGGHTFYFVTRKGRLRRLEISEAQAKLLEEGKLAVVERQDPDKIEHALVPPDIAEKMRGLFPKSVRFLNKEGDPVGFISEDELRARQEAEAKNPEPTAETEVEAEAGPTEEAHDADVAPAPEETWVEIKRA